MIRSRIAAALAVALLASAALAAPPNGSPAPELIGRTLGGEVFQLSRYRGNQAVVVNFFWVQCVPCREEMPELADLAKTYRKVAFVAVHVEDEDRDEIQRFVGTLKGAPGTVVAAGSGVKPRFQVKGLPETILIGRDGKIVEAFYGYNHANMARLKTLLAAHGQ